MTTKMYLVSWLGKGNIHWTPIETVNNNFFISTDYLAPLRAGIDLAAQNSKTIGAIQNILDPSLSKLNEIKDVIGLTQNLVALTAGLQLSTLALNIQNSLMLKEINRTVKSVNGKLDIHFLDRSLDYFKESHLQSKGINLSILSALESDLYVALQEKINSPSLQIPAYLEHKIKVIAIALQNWNEILYATIHNGHINRIKDTNIAEWLGRTKSIANRSPEGGYTRQIDILEAWGSYLKLNSSSKSTSEWSFADLSLKKTDDRTLIEKALSNSNFELCKVLLHLAREIQYTTELTRALSDKLEGQDLPVLLLKVS